MMITILKLVLVFKVSTICLKYIFFKHNIIFWAGGPSGPKLLPYVKLYGARNHRKFFFPFRNTLLDNKYIILQPIRRNTIYTPTPSMPHLNHHNSRHNNNEIIVCKLLKQKDFWGGFFFIFNWWLYMPVDGSFRSNSLLFIKWQIWETEEKTKVWVLCCLAWLDLIRSDEALAS